MDVTCVCLGVRVDFNKMEVFLFCVSMSNRDLIIDQNKHDYLS